MTTPMKSMIPYTMHIWATRSEWAALYCNVLHQHQHPKMNSFYIIRTFIFPFIGLLHLLTASLLLRSFGFFFSSCLRHLIKYCSRKRPRWMRPNWKVKKNDEEFHQKYSVQIKWVSSIQTEAYLIRSKAQRMLAFKPIYIIYEQHVSILI